MGLRYSFTIEKRTKNTAENVIYYAMQIKRVNKVICLENIIFIVYSNFSVNKEFH